jgi:type III pantothenate kinase
MAELLLDIGNTRAKAVVHRDGLLTALSLDEPIPTDISSVYYASVATVERVDAVKTDLKLGLIPWVQVSSEAERDNLRNSYAQPHLMGVDRWLAMLGARQFYPDAPLVVVDAGTALTLDVVDENGMHQGGWILPGLRLQQQAVTSHTAKVFNRDEQRPELCFGQDTASCLQNGALAAVVAVIRYGVGMVPAAKLVVTGGDAPALMHYLEDIHADFKPLLVFHGLSQFIATKSNTLASK